MFDPAINGRESGTVLSSNMYLFIQRPYEDEENAGNSQIFNCSEGIRPRCIFILSSPEIQGEMISDFGGMTLALITGTK
jgi:hypothetical protein